MTDLYLFSAREDSENRLSHVINDLSLAENAFGKRACVYATGSFGRLDAGPHSDLDLFIVVDTNLEAPEVSLLDAVDEIKLKSELIKAVEKNGLPKFDGGGRFLTSHTIVSFTKWLGSAEDDYRNTLTGRMLMLLESKPLIGEAIYHKAIDQVIGNYFRDYDGHEKDFVPSFLFNDIIRMWRTFCVNYEFHRKEGVSRDKIKNLKLKFSRMLTCYSGIVYLMGIYCRDNCVTPDAVRKMVNMTPVERLDALPDLGFTREVTENIRSSVDVALTEYSDFLQLTHKGAGAVREYNSDEAKWRGKSYKFGGCLSTMIDSLGKVSERGEALRRLILI